MTEYFMCSLLNIAENVFIDVQCMFGSRIASIRRTGAVTLRGHQKFYGPMHV